MTDWAAISRRNARSVQTTVGWIFWDPRAVERYRACGLPEAFAAPLGYIPARCAPLAAAGPEAVRAAFGSISPLGISAAFQVLGSPERFLEVWHARDEAVVAGLHEYTPEIVPTLVEFGPELWTVVESLPRTGRVFFGALLAMDRPSDPLLSGWHAINCLREWRGDTHWALVVAAGLDHAEASILHNAWLGYDRDWLPRSRGTSDQDLRDGWDALRTRGLVDADGVNAAGLALRQRIEDETDELTAVVWQRLGLDRSLEFATRLEPPCEVLLRRVDTTAGPNYQPASRVRRQRY